MQITEANSISEVLNHELARRSQKNASYSLRAFARDLQLSPSRLSEIMKGRNGLSENSLDFITKKIAKRAREQNYLRDLVLAEFARNKNVRALAQKRIEQTRELEAIRQLRADEFAVISQWFHGAILELLQLKGFRFEETLVARRLGLRIAVVGPALERLEKLGLIRRDAGGEWQSSPQPAAAFSSVPSLAIRRYHQHILSMHVESLLEDPLEEREHLSTIMAIPKSRLAELKEDLRKFQLQFWQKIANDPKDELYSFSIQFCPVKNRRPGGESLD